MDTEPIVSGAMTAEELEALKNLSQYGQKDFVWRGATTGRLQSTQPSLSQLPKTLVNGLRQLDYGSLERVLAVERLVSLEHTTTNQLKELSYQYMTMEESSTGKLGRWMDVYQSTSTQASTDQPSSHSTAKPKSRRSAKTYYPPSRSAWWEKAGR